MKTVVSLLSVCTLVAMCIMLPMWGEAQPGGGPGGGGPGGGSGGEGGRPQGPPPEAIAACEGKSEGDSCEFTNPRGDTLSGICQTVEEQLACAPEGGPGPHDPEGGQN